MARKEFTDPFPTLGRRPLFKEKAGGHAVPSSGIVIIGTVLPKNLREKSLKKQFEELDTETGKANVKAFFDKQAEKLKKPAKKKVSRRNAPAAKAGAVKRRSARAAPASPKKIGKGRPETTGKPWLAKGSKFKSRTRWYLARKEKRL